VAVELNRETILRTLEEHRSELQRLGVQRLGLFGSYLRGRPRAGSDVDLLVHFERPSFDNYVDTKFLLEDLLGREVDLVTEQALKPAVRHLRDQAAHVPGL
jgi:predicted nucleotidyltransferase